MLVVCYRRFDQHIPFSRDKQSEIGPTFRPETSVSLRATSQKGEDLKYDVMEALYLAITDFKIKLCALVTKLFGIDHGCHCSSFLTTALT
jgi:hypothetical protein